MKNRRRGKTVCFSKGRLTGMTTLFIVCALLIVFMEVFILMNAELLLLAFRVSWGKWLGILFRLIVILMAPGCIASYIAVEQILSGDL